MLTTIHIIISLIILIRTICYAKPAESPYKPMMAVLAYLIIVGSGYDIFLLLFLNAEYPLSSLFFKALIAALLLNSRGNVVDLFLTRYQGLHCIQWLQLKWQTFLKFFSNPLPPIHVAPRRKPDNGGNHA